MSEIVLAADLGGTNLRVAAVDRAGMPLHRVRVATPPSRKRDDITTAIESAALTCLDAMGPEQKAIAFGVAIPAIVGASNDTIFRAPNLPDLAGYDLVSALAERLQIPVILENDANAAAIGENWLGASKGVKNSICVMLGTGVGGGIILDGKIFRGADGTAGEVGHIVVEPNGHTCGCGGFGCVEQYSSATAVVRLAKEAASKYPDSPVALASKATAKDVFAAGKDGDALSIEVFNTFGSYLGIALAGLINVLNPEMIVIGGGASSGWDLFIGAINDQIKKRAFREPAERAKIVRAELGEDAGILGSAKLAFEEFDANGGAA